MVGGIIINKYARKVEKGDEFPNKNFWKELPGYIKVNTYLLKEMKMKIDDGFF